MVGTIKLLRAFNRDDVANGFDYANGFLFTQGIRTNRADIRISHIKTSLAKFYLAPHPGDNVAKMLYLIYLLFQ